VKESFFGRHFRFQLYLRVRSYTNRPLVVGGISVAVSHVNIRHQKSLKEFETRNSGCMPLRGLRCDGEQSCLTVFSQFNRTVKLTSDYQINFSANWISLRFLNRRKKESYDRAAAINITAPSRNGSVPSSILGSSVVRGGLCNTSGSIDAMGVHPPRLSKVGQCVAQTCPAGLQTPTAA
jgi:hypothetical protein